MTCASDPVELAAEDLALRLDYRAPEPFDLRSLDVQLRLARPDLTLEEGVADVVELAE